MRCSRPGVPGLTQSRASVSGSRRYAAKSCGSVRNFAGNGVSVPGSGRRHGSEPLAMKPSVSRMTGVMYLMAMREASMAAWKQSPGERAAMTGIGASPWRP